MVMMNENMQRRNENLTKALNDLRQSEEGFDKHFKDLQDEM